MASNFKFGMEPFEEFQGGCEESADSPDALRDFDTKMEQQEATGRKLSRDHSTSKRSLWFRKSTKRQMGAPVTSALGKSTTAMESGSPLGSKGHDNKDSLDEQREKNDQLTSFVSRSIIPDPLAEVPAWFGKENDFAVGQTVSYRIKYPIHSPSGPRWYKNEHLVPSQLRPANRPPSVFSPSFPPMASSTHDSPEDSMTRPGLSRTPSGSPMATPDSSQADVAAKPRTRKTSQTTPDNVDLLDVTDPWGTHYHHPSPYDPGLSSSSPISPVVTDTTEYSTSPRSRQSSTTAGQTRHKTVTPSPLSQSTSALHLETSDADSQIAGRKPSKYRKPLGDNLFGGQDKHADEHAPAPPVEPPPPVRSSTLPNGLHSDKRSSMMPSSLSSHISTPATHPLGVRGKKEKRGSVLGRLAKKLSIMKRPTQDFGRRSAGSVDDWQHIRTDDTQSDRNSRQSAVISRPSLLERPSTESRKTDPTKRVPAPAPETSITNAPNAAAPRPAGNPKSFISVEPPISMLKLTIANPDVPNSAENTPIAPSILLPSDANPAPDVILRPKMSSHDSQERPKSLLPPLPNPALVQEQVVPSSPNPSSPLTAPPGEVTSTPQQRPSPAEIPKSPATDPMSLYPTYINNLPNIPAIPFPVEEQRPASAISASARATIASSPVSFTDDSPLSRASLIVNPPTPYTPPAPIVSTPDISAQHAPPDRPSHNGLPSKTTQTKPKADVPKLKVEAVKPKVEAPKPKVEVPKPKVEAPKPKVETPKPKVEAPKPKVEVPKPKVEAPKPKVEVESKDEGQRGASPVTGRQTETFKLIRSSSGNVVPTSETFTAGGEQWEVVGSSDTSKKAKIKERSSRSKDRDTGNRREQKRHELSAPQANSDNHRVSRMQQSFQEQAGDQPVATLAPDSRPTRAHSMEAPHRSEQEVVSQNRKESNFNLNKPQPPPPPPTPGISRLERQPSTSARPTSELPSAAELNALRAREAWDMDRLWKGRSMHYGGHPELNGPIATLPHMRDSRRVSASTDVIKDNGSIYGAGHGSSHTSFMVQPFQSQQPPSNMYYSNMPPAPPPVIFPPATIQQTSFPTSVPYDYSYRALQPSFAFSSPDLLPEPTSRSNPLPPPPRESSYQPSPLPSLSDGRPTSDHWTIHPSVTTAH